MASLMARERNEYLLRLLASKSFFVQIILLTIPICFVNIIEANLKIE